MNNFASTLFGSLIPEMVIPIIEAFGIEVITGEKMPGEIISEKVRERIKNSDALIGFFNPARGRFGQCKVDPIVQTIYNRV